MKRAHILRAILLALLMTNGLLRAQPTTYGWTNTVAQTIGGITYITHVMTISYCYVEVPDAVTRFGTNFTQRFAPYHPPDTVCPNCFDCSYSKTNVTILGNVPPGDYRFTATTFDSFSQDYKPIASIPFTVPSTNATTVACTITNNSLSITVPGIAQARYVLEASDTMMTNWTAVATNAGAPFTWSEPVSPQNELRFYRVSVSSN